MNTHERKETEERLSNNGWQNIGICQIFSIDNVPFKLQALFIQIVRYSFGYMNAYTPRWTQAEWASKIGISRPTFTDQIHKLSELNLITINASHKYIEDGGSEAFSYSPVYPKGYGKIMLKSDESASNQIEPQAAVWTPYEEL